MTAELNFRFILRNFYLQLNRRVIRVPAPIGAGQRRLASWSTEATSHQNNRNWRHCLKNLWSKYRLPALSRVVKKHRSVVDNQLATLDLGIKWTRYETNFWHQLTSKLRTWTTFESHAAKIRNFAAKKLLVAGGRVVPLLSLIGFTVVSNDVLLTDKDKMKSLCRDIRVVMSSVDTIENNIELPKNDAVNLNLESLHFGDVIAKGCNAIVYSAKWAENHNAGDLNTVRTRTASDDSGIESSVEVLSPNDEGFSFNTCFERESNAPKSYKNKNDFQRDILNKSFNGYNLAVKMMFNYEAESNAPAIIQAMYKEIVPSRRHTNLLTDDSDGYEQRKKYLPPHPNVVELHYSFADYVPHLPRAMLLYPDALPRRINSNGSGRNMTLFLLMKRYQCSLKDYLQMYDPTPRTRLLLLAQLLEGITHLVKNNVAHRDLKNDNILLDLSEGPEFPKLVITDFGCCLADEELGLKLPYFTVETSKGGNSALMAPEVASARPGRCNIIDYSKADMWAAGTLAYEIFGQNNPFLNTKSARLDSRTYKESDLLVPEDPAINPVILDLIRGMLQRNPIKRPEVNVAADICILMLFAPSKWINQRYLSKRTVINWLVNFAAKNLIEKNNSSLPHVEHLLSTSFLRRITLDEIMKSVAFLQNVKY